MGRVSLLMQLFNGLADLLHNLRVPLLSSRALISNRRSRFLVASGKDAREVVAGFLTFDFPSEPVFLLLVSVERVEAEKQPVKETDKHADENEKADGDGEALGVLQAIIYKLYCGGVGRHTR
jgi:hypothetical protein